MEYDPMLTFDELFKSHPREKLLEMRIENLQDRIHELEQRSSLRYSVQPDMRNSTQFNRPSFRHSAQPDIRNSTQANRSSFLVLPIAYTPAPEPSPHLEIVPYSSTENHHSTPTISIEQGKTRKCETVV